MKNLAVNSTMWYTNVQQQATLSCNIAQLTKKRLDLHELNQTINKLNLNKKSDQGAHMPSNVLVVGNESESLKNLPNHLSPYSSDFTIITAATGEEAVEILRASMIDLLVTDLKIPQKNGFQLLFNITTQHPLVPILIINTYAEDSCNENAASPTVEKSINPEELRNTILEISKDPKKAGAIFGVCLGNFLQLIEKENGSCMLTVLTPSRTEGFFLFKDGVLAQAFLNNTRGKEAALAMLAHEKVSIMIRKLPERNIPNEIECSVRSILTEAVQHKNENAIAENIDNKLNSSEEFDKNTSPQGATRFEENEENESNIVLNKVLQELTTISGVKAVGFMRFSGEMLAVKSNKDTPKPDMIITTFNDILCKAHEACKKINMETIDEVIIDTPKGTIIMLCLEIYNVEHIHLITLLNPDGNRALFKIKAAKLISVMESYS